jgi:hypothetical protein
MNGPLTKGPPLPAATAHSIRHDHDAIRLPPHRHTGPI